MEEIKKKLTENVNGKDDQYNVEEVENRNPYRNYINLLPSTVKFFCRCIRIGSYKAFPVSGSSSIAVQVSSDKFRFVVSKVNGGCDLAVITLKDSDITRVYAHFSRVMPLLFVETTVTSTTAIQKALGMVAGSLQYYNPESKDETEKRITFLIEMTKTQDKYPWLLYLRQVFPGEETLKEIQGPEANTILVKSTPQQKQHSKIITYVRPLVKKNSVNSTSHADSTNESSPQNVTVTENSSSSSEDLSLSRCSPLTNSYSDKLSLILSYQYSSSDLHLNEGHLSYSSECPEKKENALLSFNHCIKKEEASSSDDSSPAEVKRFKPESEITDESPQLVYYIENDTNQGKCVFLLNNIEDNMSFV